MHVTACLAGQKEEVEVGEDCRSLLALKQAIVVALPKLCVEGFDVSVGERALDSDESIVSLEQGASLDVVPNKRGLSILALREAGHDVSEAGLLEAVQSGDVELCTLYLDAGVPPNSTTWGNMTPLHLTMQQNKLGLFKVFLDRQQDGDVQCTLETNGMTLLHFAVVHNRPVFCELLLNRGHPVQCVTHAGKTPLHFAAKRRSTVIPEMLLERHHDVQCADDAGSTPLHAAAESANVRMCEFLLDHKHDLECVDEEGSTPLHYVCGGINCVDTCRFLLERGHSAHVKDSNGKTPLDLAQDGGAPDVRELMEQQTKKVE